MSVINPFKRLVRPRALGKGPREGFFDKPLADHELLKFRSWLVQAGSLLSSNSIKTNLIKPGAVTTPKIAPLSITAAEIAAAAVEEAKVNDGAISAAKIASNAVTSDKVLANAIIAGKIAAGAIETDKLAANAVTAGKIAANTITSGQIAAGTITANEIAALTITAGVIKASAIETDKINGSAVTTGKVASDAITQIAFASADASSESGEFESVTVNRTAGTDLIIIITWICDNVQWNVDSVDPNTDLVRAIHLSIAGGSYAAMGETALAMYRYQVDSNTPLNDPGDQQGRSGLTVFCHQYFDEVNRSGDTDYDFKLVNGAGSNAAIQSWRITILERKR